MEEQLLQYTQFEDNFSEGKPHVSAPETKYFASPKHVGIRAAFACIALLSFIVNGASCYAFPLLLTQILPDIVHLTTSQISFLGGMIYISLGVSGAILLISKKANLPPVTEFVFWTVAASLIAVIPWVLLYWIVTTPKSASCHNAGVVVVALLCQGFASGILFNIWGMYLILLFKERYVPFVIIAINIAYPLGAILVFAAKYSLSGKDWVFMELILQGSFYAVGVIFSIAYRNEVLNLPEPVAHDGSMLPSTMTMIGELLTGKRKNVPLLDDAENSPFGGLGDCNVTSFQFYFIALTYFLFNSVGSAFMANIGPLTAHDDNSSAGEKKQLGIFIAAMIGQLVGRTLMPVLYMAVEWFCMPTRPAEMTNDLVWSEYSQRVLVTWRNLGLTIAVCVVFIVCLLLLQLIPSFPYIFAFTIISMGYGMMWVITTNYPTFFHPTHFSVLGSIFMFGGSLFTIMLLSLISGLKMNKDGIFATLLVGSVASFASALIVHINIRRRQQACLKN
jgi:hypothetical protein